MPILLPSRARLTGVAALRGVVVDTPEDDRVFLVAILPGGLPGRDRQGVQGAHLNPLGLSLEPPGPLLTRLHTVYIGRSECLTTRLNPLAEGTCFSQWPSARSP